MATRFYLPSTGAAPVSPAYDAGWEDTANATSRLAMVTTRIDSSFVQASALETGSSTVNARDLLIRQYVSNPLSGNQTISGTLKGQMQISENNAAANFMPQMVVRVVSGDGTTVRGTLHAGDTRTTNVDEVTISTVEANVKNPAAGISPVTLTSVNALDGDRVVVEIGVRANNTSATNYTAFLYVGDVSGTDLTEGGSETELLNPWIEFSANLSFQSPSSPPPSPPPPSSPTRFYLPSTGAAAVSPAYDAEWDDTANAASRLTMVRTRISSAFATINVSETGGSSASPRDLLARQYVSEPIVGAQTISGTLKGQMSMTEDSFLANFLPQMVVRVVSNDGSSVRGTLYAGDTRTTSNVDEMFNGQLTNLKNPADAISPVALSSVAAQNGDRIVVEVGARANNTQTTDYVLSARFGDNAGSDLTEGGTETTDLNPWVQFSAAINFVAQMTEGVGMVPI